MEYIVCDNEEFVPVSELIGKKMWQICNDHECLHKPLLNVKIGNKIHNYCCKNGFEKSLKQFRESLNKWQQRRNLHRKKTINNPDGTRTISFSFIDKSPFLLVPKERRLLIFLYRMKITRGLVSLSLRVVYFLYSLKTWLLVNMSRIKSD